MHLLENPILQLTLYAIIPLIVTLFFKRLGKPNSTLNVILSFTAAFIYFFWVTGYDARMIEEAQDHAHQIHCGNVMMGVYIGHAIIGVPAALITQIILSFVWRKKR